MMQVLASLQCVAQIYAHGEESSLGGREGGVEGLCQVTE